MAEIPESVLKEAADLADRRARISEAFGSKNAALNLEQLRADLLGDGPSFADMVERRLEANGRLRRAGFAHRGK